MSLLPPSRRTVVCVLGMSRTGTSLTTRLLNLSGVYLGPEEGLLKPRPANPEGFWEHFRIMRLNEQVLKTLGGNWRSPPEMPAGWEQSERLAAEREQAVALLQETFSGHELWGWKDPRNSLTLPLWQRLLPDARYVICLRNPVDVAASLEARDEIALEDGFALWLRYVASALVNTSRRPRVFVSYEEYFDDCQPVAQRLARFIGLDAPPVGAVTVNERLWHHRTPPEDVAADTRVPAEVVSLHLITELLRAASSQEPGGARTNELARAADAYARRLLAAQASEPRGQRPIERPLS